MSTDVTPGHAFSISLCQVVDVNDPTQSGMCRLKELVGSGQTSQLASDVSNLPWHPMLYPSTNPNLKNIGGPHTGIKVGSNVLVLNFGKDKQDRCVLGTMCAAGNATPDGQPQFDSNVPPHAKIQQVADVTQPNYGDKAFSGMKATDTPNQPQNSQQSQQQIPIWYYAQTQGGIGQQGKSALYADLRQDQMANYAALTLGFGQTSG